MARLKWWMRIVGGFYLLMFTAAAVLRLPIRSLGPPDTLARAASGDATARLLVDTWVTLGLEFAALGVALLIASRVAEQARALAWTVIGIEAVRALVTDVYMITRGHDLTPQLVWIGIHSAIIATGVLALRKADPAA